MRAPTVCRQTFAVGPFALAAAAQAAVLAGVLGGAMTAAPAAARAERAHVDFTYQKITLSTAKPENASKWIRNGQPHTRPTPSNALADLPQAPNGRIPPHTPDIKLNRGVSTGGNGATETLDIAHQGFKGAPRAGTRSWMPPANTKYTPVKLGRAR